MGMSGFSEIYDPLTGAYTRATLNARLQDEIARSQRYGDAFALLMLDLDYFKSINDAFGHGRGDEMLVGLVERIRQIVRTSDLVFRYGGDEFVVLLPNTDKPTAVSVAERLLERIAGEPFAGSPPISISLSIGVASFPQDAISPEGLFALADQRHYQAKRNGRGRVVSLEEVAKPVDMLDPPDRLIGRDIVLEQVDGFIDLLPEKRRGVLAITGERGAGRTRLLQEIHKLARLLGYGVLSIVGKPALQRRRSGALAEAHWRWPELPSPAKDLATFALSLRQMLEEKGESGVILLVDDWQWLDQDSTERLQELFFISDLPQLALIASGTPGSLTNLQIETPLHEHIALDALSLDSLRIWLRHSLYWEAPTEFSEWLMSHTSGYPSAIQRGLTLLHERGYLQRKGLSWLISPQCFDLPLGSWLDTHRETTQAWLNSQSMLVGRDEIIRQIKQSLVDARAVALVGLPGSGKTRLGVQVASEEAAGYAQGMLLVDCEDAAGLDDVLAQLGELLFITAPVAGGLPAQVIEMLRPQERLIFFDSLPNDAPTCAWLTELLQEALGVRLIITGKDAPDLPGCSVFPLRGLEYPAQDETNPERFPAIQLLLATIQRVDPDYKPGRADWPSLITMTRLVEGLPLSLELIGGWMPALYAHELLSELERQPERDLEGALNLVWGLLSEPEHVMLRKLGVFRSSFSASAARRVAGVSAFFLDGLTSKSLLRMLRPDNGANLYRMHPRLRRFVRAKLALHPDEQHQTMQAHASYYLQQAAGLQASFASADAQEFMAAWDWAAQHGQYDLIEAALPGLAKYSLESGWAGVLSQRLMDFPAGDALPESLFQSLQFAHQQLNTPPQVG